MSKHIAETLHDIHTATNDVLKGYREMQARAEPDIQAVITRLTDLHQRHSFEQKAELARLRETGKDDSSIQGTINKAVVVMRDWVSDLDRDVLPAVRKGEESLQGKYKDALEDSHLQSNPSVRAVLASQLDAINREIAQLPKD